MVLQQTNSGLLADMYTIFSYPIILYCVLISFLCYAMLNINTNRLPCYLVSDTSVVVKDRHEDRRSRGFGIEHSDSGY